MQTIRSFWLALQQSIQQSLQQSPAWLLWAVLLLVSAIWASLYIHQFFDYGYPLWFSVLDIEQHIQTYGASNYYKAGFDRLTPDQYYSLFSQISWSVNHHGEGLAQIHYSTDDAVISMLRQPEIIHLQDVADLLRKANFVGLCSLILWLLLTLYLRCSQKVVSAKALLMQLTFLITTSFSIIVVVGFKKIFYWLHILVFPSENQWFFYYQESLMATLMKAPELFAGIAVTVLLLAIVIMLTTLMVWKRNLVKP